MHSMRDLDDSVHGVASTPNARQQLKSVVSSIAQGVASITRFGRMTMGLPILSRFRIFFGKTDTILIQNYSKDYSAFLAFRIQLKYA